MIRNFRITLPRFALTLAMTHFAGITDGWSVAVESRPKLEFNGNWIDHRGEGFKSDQLNGHYTLVVLAYSSCPTLCPMTADRVRKIDDAVAKSHPGVRVVLVAIDPENETPATMREWLEKRKLNRKNWSFVKGTRDNTHEVASQLTMGFSDQRSPSHISHTSKIALIGPGGRLELVQEILSNSVSTVVKAFDLKLSKSSPL